MGEKKIARQFDRAAAREFTRAILDDIRALEVMIDENLIEHDVRRVGAEQEMFLVDQRGMAAPAALRLMEQLAGDPRFQTEVALFNLEANLPPQTLGGPFLRHLERELNDVLAAARSAARAVNAEVLLTGILPTLRREDLLYKNLTPEPRYKLLNSVSLSGQGGSINISVDGLDNFKGKFDTVVIEGANTSLQLHLQVGADEAARLYNLAQLITAPLLAVATNSPVFLGKRIWQETRVAVFERAMDDRSASQLARGVPTRVGFGSAWLKNSLVELFRDNVARFPVIMTCEIPENPLDVLAAGRPPDLRAMVLHNSTVWRWNRPCFGITDGQPHLRIESRILPAGPTILDEVANTALFYGLMVGLEESYGDVTERLRFSQAKENFLASAHYGLNASYAWLDGQRITARELLRSHLIPAARRGLASVKVPAEDIDRYLGIIESRVESGQTGASWLMEGLSQVPQSARPELCRRAVHKMLEQEQGTDPVHRWAPLISDGESEMEDRLTLGDIMSTDVFTLAPEDLVDLATSMMEWQHFRHVPVEDERGRLIGLLSTRHLLRLRNSIGKQESATAVREIMNEAPLTAATDMTVAEGMERMLTTDNGCILVVHGEHLVGIVTERDMLRVAHRELTRPVANE